MGTSSASISINITARDVLNSGLAKGVIPMTFAQVLELSNGLTDANIDLAWSTSVVGGAASSTISYDLVGTVLKDKFGGAVSFAEVVLIAVKNNRADAGAYLTVGPHPTNGFGRLSGGKGFWPADLAADGDQGSVVGPSAWYVVYDPAGVPTVAGTGDILAITTSGTTGSTNAWDILVLGRSA